MKDSKMTKMGYRCPSCGSLGPFDFKLDAEASVATDSHGENSHIKLTGWTVDIGALHQCEKCLFTGKEFMFRDIRNAWVYSGGSVYMVMMVEFGFIKPDQCLVLAPDPDHKDGCSRIAMRTETLFDSRGDALAYAIKHLGMIQAFFDGIRNENTVLLGEYQAEYENMTVHPTGSEQSKEGEGDAQ